MVVSLLRVFVCKLLSATLGAWGVASPSAAMFGDLGKLGHCSWDSSSDALASPHGLAEPCPSHLCVACSWLGLQCECGIPHIGHLPYSHPRSRLPSWALLTRWRYSSVPARWGVRLVFKVLWFFLGLVMTVVGHDWQVVRVRPLWWFGFLPGASCDDGHINVRLASQTYHDDPMLVYAASVVGAEGGRLAHRSKDWLFAPIRLGCRAKRRGSEGNMASGVPVAPRISPSGARPGTRSG